MKYMRFNVWLRRTQVFLALLFLAPMIIVGWSWWNFATGAILLMVALVAPSQDTADETRRQIAQEERKSLPE